MALILFHLQNLCTNSLIPWLQTKQKRKRFDQRKKRKKKGSQIEKGQMKSYKPKVFICLAMHNLDMPLLLCWFHILDGNSIKLKHHDLSLKVKSLEGNYNHSSIYYHVKLFLTNLLAQWPLGHLHR